MQQQQQTAPVSLSTCHPAEDDIAYETEHIFMENGKEVRKMPVRVGKETMWVDCVTSEIPGEIQSDALVLHLDDDMSSSALFFDDPAVGANVVASTPTPKAKANSSGRITRLVRYTVRHLRM
jgi:hypothetical protein